MHLNNLLKLFLFFDKDVLNLLSLTIFKNLLSILPHIDIM